MFEYELRLGYESSTRLHPFLGKVQYKYPLQKGDVIILVDDLFKELEKHAVELNNEALKYQQQFRVGSIHHTFGGGEHVPQVFLVTESKYLKQYADQAQV